MRIYLILISFLLAFQAQSQVDLAAKMDTTAIRIGEQVQLELEVRYEGKSPQVKWPEIKDTLQLFIEVIDPGVIDTFHVGEVSRQSRLLTITSWDSGYWAIPPFEFEIDGQQAETEALLLSVNTVPVDTTAAPMDIKPLMEAPLTFAELLKIYYPWIIGFLFLILITLGIIYLIRRSKTPEVAPVIVKRQIDIEALEALKLMKAKRSWEENSPKSYYIALTDILREYIEYRFGIPAQERTTYEMMELISDSKMDQDNRLRLQDILNQADMAKFAKLRPSPMRMSVSLDESIAFIESTRAKEEIPTVAHT